MTEITKVESAPLAVASPEEAAQSFIRTAMQNGTSVGDMEKLLTIWKDLVSDGKKTAFDRAMTQFQADCPPMPRGHESHLQRVNAAGAKVPARYSDMSDIAKTIGPCLKANGLAYDWSDTEIVVINGETYYRAHLIIRHEAGHSELKSGPPIPMGKNTNNQSPQMQAAAVVTTAQRLCLRSAFGLWSIDQNEEDAANAPKPETITGDQITELMNIIGDDAALESRMLKAVSVENIADIPSAKFEYVRGRLAAAKGKA